MSNNSIVLGIVVAMDKELELLKEFVTTSSVEFKNNQKYLVCSYENLILIITKSGIGKVNAAITAMTLIEHYKPAMIISTGVCGGLKKTGMKQGDVIIGSTLKYHDVWCGVPNKPGQIQGMPEHFRSVYGLLMKMAHVNCDGETGLSEQFKKNFNAELLKITDVESNIHYGEILTGDWFVDTKEKAEEIKNKFPEGIAIDMESTSIAHVCNRFEQASSYIRVVSDVPLSEDEQQRNYSNFWETAPNILLAALKTFLYSYFIKKQ